MRFCLAGACRQFQRRAASTRSNPASRSFSTMDLKGPRVRMRWGLYLLVQTHSLTWSLSPRSLSPTHSCKLFSQPMSSPMLCLKLLSLAPNACPEGVTGLPHPRSILLPCNCLSLCFRLPHPPSCHCQPHVDLANSPLRT